MLTINNVFFTPKGSEIKSEWSYLLDLNHPLPHKRHLKILNNKMGVWVTKV